MNFLNRLKYYLVGVGLGILMVMVIFKDRKFTSWTPQNRVLYDIKEKTLVISSKMSCLFECGNVKSNESIDEFLDTADVDFKASNVENRDFREYVLLFEDHLISEVVVIISKDEIEIKSISLPKVDCSCF